MVRVKKRRRSEYNDLINESSQLFQIKEDTVKQLVNDFSKTVHEVVKKRPRRVDSIKALNRNGFDVSKAAEDFMNRTFQETEEEEPDDDKSKNDAPGLNEESEVFVMTPAVKRRRQSDPYKVPGVNTDNPAEIFNRTVVMTQRAKRVQAEDDDVSVIWFDKFMTQRKTQLPNRNDGSGTDISGILNLSVEEDADIDRTQDFDEDGDTDRNAIFACKFTENASQMLKNCFETIRKIHGGKLSNQMCEIKVMPQKKIWLENNRGRQIKCVVPEEIVFTVAAQPGRQSDVITVTYKRQAKMRYSCFSFAKYSNGFKNEVRIAVSALKVRDILKELGKQQSLGILIKNNNGLKKCFLMITGSLTKFNFTMDVMSMEEANPDIASFVPPMESQSEDLFTQDNQTVLIDPQEHAHAAAVAERSSRNDILASIIFNHASLKRDIDALKSFGEVGELHIVQMPREEEDEEEYWAEFRTKSSGTEAKVPMSKDGVHNITKIHIKPSCERELLERPVKLSLKVLSSILSLSNMSVVKMDIHELQGVGMFFKFAPAYGQGQVNYYFNQINPANAQVQSMSEETQEIGSMNDFQ